MKHKKYYYEVMTGYRQRGLSTGSGEVTPQWPGKATLPTTASVQ